MSPEVARAIADGAPGPPRCEVGVGITGVAGWTAVLRSSRGLRLLMCVTTADRRRPGPRRAESRAGGDCGPLRPTPGCTCCCVRRGLTPGPKCVIPGLWSRVYTPYDPTRPGAGFSREARGTGVSVNRRRAWSRARGSPFRTARRRPDRAASATASRLARTSKVPQRSRWPRRSRPSTARFDLLCVFVAAGVRHAPGLIEAAAPAGDERGGSATTLGATAAGVCGDGHGVDHSPAVAVWAATLPGARLHPFRPGRRRTPYRCSTATSGPPRCSSTRTPSRSPGSCRTPLRCRWWGVWPARGGPS